MHVKKRDISEWIKPDPYPIHPPHKHRPQGKSAPFLRPPFHSSKKKRQYIFKTPYNVLALQNKCRSFLLLAFGWRRSLSCKYPHSLPPILPSYLDGGMGTLPVGASSAGDSGDGTCLESSPASGGASTPKVSSIDAVLKMVRDVDGMISRLPAARGSNATDGEPSAVQRRASDQLLIRGYCIDFFLRLACLLRTSTMYIYFWKYRYSTF